ncbi:MAG: hypothetical protein ACRDQ5_00875 [Sciscionella sp.]
MGLETLLLGYHDGDRLRYAGQVGTRYDERTLRTSRGRLDEFGQGSGILGSPACATTREPPTGRETK